MITVVSEPGTRLADDAVLDGNVDEASLSRNSLPEHDVEFRNPERRSNFVLDDLGSYPVSDVVGSLFDRLDPPDVDTNARVELEGPATRGRLR